MHEAAELPRTQDAEVYASYGNIAAIIDGMYLVIRNFNEAT